MELETTHTSTTAKLSMLKQENGNSFKPVAQTTTNDVGTSTTHIPGPITTEEKAQKKNDVKARKTRFGGNEATKKTQKTLLKKMYENFSATSTKSLDSILNRLQKIISQLAVLGESISHEDLNLFFLRSLHYEWNTHVVVWRNKYDLDRMSIDDLYNNFKIVEQEVKGTTSTNSSAQNMAFVSSPSSTNEVNTAYGVSTANTQVNTASTQVSTANLSDATVYAFLASQPNGSQLAHEDLVQIHEDDLEEMDLKWQLSLLSIRTRRGLAYVEEHIVFYKKNEVLFSKEIVVLKRDISYKDSDISVLKRSQIADNCKKSLGYESYHAVLPPPTGLFSPLKLDLSNSSLEEFKQPEFERYGPKSSEIESKNASKDIPNEIKEQTNASLVKKLVLDNKDCSVESLVVVEKKTVVPTIAKIKVVRPKQQENPVRKPVREMEVSGNNYTRVHSNNSTGKTHPSTYRNMALKAVLIKTGIRPLNTARPVNTAHPRTTVYSARPMPRPVNTTRPRLVNTARPRPVNTARPRLVNTVRPNSAVVNAVRVNRVNAVKASAYSSQEWLGSPKETNFLILCAGSSTTGVLLKVPRRNNMYSVDMKNIVPKESLTCLVAKATLDESMLWHRRLGHINLKNINKLVKDNLVRGLPLKRFKNDQTCVACLKGKKQSLLYTWVFFLATKNETTCILKKFITEIENLVDKKVKIIICDNGTEFKNSVMNDFCAIKVIRREFSIARTPQQNGVVERRNKTLIEAAKTMLANSKLPTTFWAEAESLMENDDGLFVGYSLNSKAFRVYKLRTRKVEENLHIKFLEDKPSIAGTEDSIGEGHSSKENRSSQDYILMTLWKMVYYLTFLQRMLAKMNYNLLVMLNIRMMKSAFLYGRIEEEVYVCQPLGFKDLDHPDKELCTEFERLMKDKFQMSSMGELTFFLGLQVKQKEYGIFISQDKYVTEVLRKFNFLDVKSANTPVDMEKTLVKDVDGDDVDVHLYRSMIGSLMYLTTSRPDIIYAVCVCARFQVIPKVSHLHVVKRIFRYLKGHPKLGLWYPRDSLFELVAYIDSDYVRASLDRKSTTGGYQFLGSRLISWQCKNQTVVATSITKAEYVAAASCCRQAYTYYCQLKVNAVKCKFTTAGDVKTVNGEVQIQALVNKKNVIITETSVRSDLHLEDAEEIPTESHHTPTVTQPSTASQTQQKQKSKKFKKRITKVPQLSESTHDVADEHVTTTSKDPLSANQALENTSLKRRVKKLKKRASKKSHKLKRLYKIGSSTRVEFSKDISLSDQVDASKQERMIEDLDADEGVGLVNETQGRNDQDMFDTSIFDDEEVVAEKEVSTIKVVTTAGVEVVTTAGVESSKPKAKGIVIQDPSKTPTPKPIDSSQQPSKAKDKGKAKIIKPEKPLKRKDQIMIDEEDNTQAMIDVDYKLAARLQEEESGELNIEENSRLFVELMDKRKKHFARLKAKKIKSKPPTKAQKRNHMCTYLKNMLVKGSEKAVEGSEKAKEGSSKRVTDKLEQKDAKRQRIEDENESAELNRCLEIILDDDVTIEATPLSSKSPTIVDYKIYKEGRKSFFKIIRADGNSQNYLTFGMMFKNFNREDLKVLWSILKARFKKTKPVDDMDNLLFQTLKTMFEHHVEDNVSIYKNILHQMWNDVRLQVDYEVEMAYDLLRLIRKQINEGYVPE
uniref:Uncharacterized mitochondrial protein AtMg00810-like n=1 Tax=Tanacetum cinerariifolium TaxID=118510 RepID=A0A6L2JZT0_TANCI|nr:uncharacterized mitochondrial protein AtMg00810-like [Tanacetum cinerariifolium]